MLRTKSFRMKYNEQAKSIVDKLTLSEKVYLMSGYNTYEDLLIKIKEDPLKNHYNVIPYGAGGLEKYNIQPMLFVDGPRGVVCGVGKSTCFPVSMLRGASFNIDIEKRIGNAIGKEIRAYGGNLFGGVCINLPYNPGWGRSQESYGEESFHLGAMGSALTKGIQEEDVIACIKHFAFNQMENSRFEVSVTCDDRTEQEVFLPHFKDCIDSGAASVMSSYNKYNDVYCGHSNYLLNNVLKKDWDFDGFVISDFVWGVKDTVEAANGGQDIEMCFTTFFGDKLIKAVEGGFVPEEKIDQAATRIVRTMLAFTDNQKQYGEEVIGCKEHVDLALQAAREGITLIKNEEDILPVKNKKILVLGELATKENLGDKGSSNVYPKSVKIILDEIKNNNANCEVLYNEGSNQEEVNELAHQVDEIIIVAGYDFNDEGEYVSKEEHDNYLGAKGGDRQSLNLHDKDVALIQNTSEVNNNIIVVLIGGNTILMTEWVDKVKAVVMAYYLGQEGAVALSEIIFGEISPSGKLPYVIPVLEQDLPYVDWFTDKQYYEYYHGYARLDKNDIKPLYHYGHGLSYTSFNIDLVDAYRNGDEIIVECKVKNVGNMKGAEVVQVYIGFENSEIDRPKKLLRGFSKVHLEEGEETIITIPINIEKLKWYNPVLAKWELEDIEYEVLVGNSSKDEDFVSKKIKL